MSCDVNFSCSIKEEHVTKEHCGRSGIMGYVTFHHKTRRGPPAVTWETASVVFLTTTTRHVAHHRHICVCVFNIPGALKGRSNDMMTLESSKLHSEVMIWFPVLTFNASQIFPSHSASVSVSPTSKTNLGPGRWPGILEIIQQLKNKNRGGKKRGGKVKMEWSFRGKGRQDGDMNWTGKSLVSNACHICFWIKV